MRFNHEVYNITCTFYLLLNCFYIKPDDQNIYLLNKLIRIMKVVYRTANIKGDCGLNVHWT